MTAAVNATEKRARSRGPAVAPNAQCPACGHARFGTRVVQGHVHVACEGCDATFSSVLELVTRRASARSGARTWWLVAAVGAGAALVGLLALT